MEMYMARAIVKESDLPPYAVAYVERIKAFGFGWKFFEDYPLAHKRIQVRNIGEKAPLQETSKYRQALKRGDQFPPVVQTADRYLVDGNTRTEAAEGLGWGFPTFVLDVKAEGAPDSVIKQLKALGAGFNATHGRRMSAANFAEIIDSIAVEDDTPRDIAQRLHLPESTATTLLNAAKAQHRAERLGVTLNGSLTNSHLKMFGGKADKFTDPVFASFISLAQDAKLTLATTTAIAKTLAQTGTENERLALLESERRGYRSVIEGGSVHPSKAARLRQSLGYLINIEDPDLLAELDPNASRLHVQTLREAAIRLELAMGAQERVERQRAERNSGE